MWFDGGLLTTEVELLVVAASVGAALSLDSFLGEPSRFHPLVGFGNWANWVERVCRQQFLLINRQTDSGNPETRLRSVGIAAWCLAVLPILIVVCALMVWLAQVSFWLWLLISVIVLYFTLGGNSLVFHASEIYRPLKAGDITLAREKISFIVSRETASMNKKQITSATVESVLENGNDAVFGAIFWFVVAGAPGALLFRLANTLDAMWGYKNERYRYFGFAAAKLDDFLGWIPARLTALTYGIQGNLQLAMKCWQEQATLCASPNGGVVMCAGAGALNTTIGGPAIYHGKYHEKIYMGNGEFADYPVIIQANRLVICGAWVWVLVLLLLGLG
ncbi:adenosylcobinamide-phosphate synthase CbiB [Photobacterium alginatilyticum]|uniref:Cobalamin biosynthesis protein CobD n=1 Tax=Photobacterium alginatilyticum TaxID=1775171 RepID=A0ABW9YI84_9GAMM|nr:adenosylcobinamide-phosphate synthase CbiB [Photobacterium alginatilyticum]NBI52986.1 cobalamin biosynthesis protein [Photobacterium alginatilyticum]